MQLQSSTFLDLSGFGFLRQACGTAVKSVRMSISVCVCVCACIRLAHLKPDHDCSKLLHSPATEMEHGVDCVNIWILWQARA